MGVRLRRDARQCIGVLVEHEGQERGTGIAEATSLSPIIHCRRVASHCEMSCSLHSRTQLSSSIVCRRS
jgi:hypothetical protein